jgi:uncharacterized protein YbaP (TraB family)
MLILFRIQAIRLVITLLIFTVSLNAFADPALWKIQGKENSVYLFGSIHVANKSMYPLGDNVEAAFKQSDVLVVEVDEAQINQVKLQEIMMSRGFYSGTETIKDHVNIDTLESLQRLLADIGIPYVTVARMKPGIIAMTLTVALMVKMGYSPELGIDRYFMQRARGNKKIQQLETMEEQMNLLLSFSDDNLMLKQTLVSLEKLPQMISELIDSWKSGDEKTLEKLMLTDQVNEYPEFKNVLKRLIDDRNLTMTTKIQDFLNDNKDYFVVVGAGHLVGEKGIVSLLKQNGVSVQRL